MPCYEIKTATYSARKIRSYPNRVLIPGGNPGKFPNLCRIAHFAFAHFRFVPAWQSPSSPMRNLRRFVKVVPSRIAARLFFPLRFLPSSFLIENLHFMLPNLKVFLFRFFIFLLMINRRFLLINRTLFVCYG